METQKELQSAAQTFYQQVVRVLRQKVLIEREHPGLMADLTSFTLLIIQLQL